VRLFLPPTDSERIVAAPRLAILLFAAMLAALLALVSCQTVPTTGLAVPTERPEETPEANPTPFRDTAGLMATPYATHVLPTAPTEIATTTPTPTLPLLQRTENLLVLGVDHRAGDPDPSWRTDTIMIVAIDQGRNQVGVVSIPRDLYVDIPGLGMGRINRADYYGHWTKYPGGGPALLSRVISDTLGIPTEHYVRIQMEGLVSLVDAMDGVTVTLDCPLFERTPDETSPNGVVDWNLPAGEVHLDGADAKKFATYRYVTSDFGRAQRQQQLIWAMRDRVLQLDLVPRVPELWSGLRDTFYTDLDLVTIIKLINLAARMRPEDVHGFVFDSEILEHFITEEGSWVLLLKDRERLSADLESLFDTRPLADIGQQSASGACPPEPTPVPTFTPTPTEEPTPPATN
jgi:LCP family protein required for cell wall assembly